MEGIVDLWPELKTLKITAAITLTQFPNQVIFLHSDNDYYSLYDFTDVSKPKKVSSGKAQTKDGALTFLDPKTTPTVAGTSLKSTINVCVSLTFKAELYLLSKDTFCTINMNGGPSEKVVSFSVNYFNQQFVNELYF